MINLLLAGALASSVLKTSLPASSSAAVLPYSTVLNQSAYSSYTVMEGDYLSKIADAYYGSEDYWTNIWNDNPEVKDAAQLEKGTILKIRKVKSALPEALDLELQKRTTTGIAGYNYEFNSYTVPSAGASASITPTQAPIAASVSQPAQSPNNLSEEQITYLGNCEAGMNPARNSGNGYYGAFQFSYGTWKSMNTGYERADLAPIEVQKQAVRQLVQRSSIFTQFPACARKMSSVGII